MIFLKHLAISVVLSAITGWTLAAVGGIFSPMVALIAGTFGFLSVILYCLLGDYDGKA